MGPSVPVIYLRGIKQQDMEAVLSFMYHGEVNVAQDNLNSFLSVAEDLKVKGNMRAPHLGPRIKSSLTSPKIQPGSFEEIQKNEKRP